VDEFVGQCIETVTTDSNISWKNMHYIWKLYLTNLNIPNMIYSTQLQSILIGKIENSKIENSKIENSKIENSKIENSKIENTLENGIVNFTHVTSKYLPNVSSFLSFWDKHITITNDNNLDDEYEIDEFITLYKMSESKNTQISDINMIKMICHYFSPQVEVIDNKYITNIKCNLWSKHDDINEFLDLFKSNTVETVVTDLISFDDLYQGYRNHFKSKGIIEQRTFPIVSKQFFEKYLTNQLSSFIQFEKFVSIEWLHSS
jgi:hypothetical protein